MAPRSDFCKRPPPRAAYLANGNPEPRSHFHKGAPAARRENRLSARGKHTEALPAADAARCAWRRAPIVAGARRGAPQKSAKRKREHPHVRTSFTSRFPQAMIPSPPPFPFRNKGAFSSFKKSQPDDMCVRLGHLQGNGTQGVCGPQSGTCAVLCPILSKRGILGGKDFCRATARRNWFPLKHNKGAFSFTDLCGMLGVYDGILGEGALCVPWEQEGD